MTYRTLFRNIAEQLIEKGLASAVRHKRDDEDRSPDYDKLIAAEQAYVNIRFHPPRSYLSTELLPILEEFIQEKRPRPPSHL